MTDRQKRVRKGPFGTIITLTERLELHIETDRHGWGFLIEMCSGCLYLQFWKKALVFVPLEGEG